MPAQKDDKRKLPKPIPRSPRASRDTAGDLLLKLLMGKPTQVHRFAGMDATTGLPKEEEADEETDANNAPIE